MRQSGTNSPFPPGAREPLHGFVALRNLHGAPRPIIPLTSRLDLDQLGMVASGKNADFLVLDANPVNNIANTRRIWRVYLRGREVDRAALRKRLKGEFTGSRITLF